MYNFLNKATSITNAKGCRFDTSHSFTTNFKTNCDHEGWDTYFNVCLYGVWEGLLFGTFTDTYAYLGRSDGLIPFEAIDYYTFTILFKLEDNNPKRAVAGLSKAKIMWRRLEDSYWDDKCSIVFDIAQRNTWHEYHIELRQSAYWTGTIVDIRIFPCIDARKKDAFYISTISLSSNTKFLCANRTCDYFINYKHLCPGAGSSGYIESYPTADIFTFYKGENSFLTISIDDYGKETFDLGTQINISALDLAKQIETTLSTISVGSYTYVNVSFTKSNTFIIESGTLGEFSTVVIYYSSLAEKLGFFNKNGEPLYKHFKGQNPASGFEYKSTVLLSSYTKNNLSNSISQELVYIHMPTNYSVEAGRVDFVSTFVTLNDTAEVKQVYSMHNLDSFGKTVVDISHPISANGRLHIFRFSGFTYSNSQLKVLRPLNNGGYKVIHSVPFGEPEADILYTKKANLFKLDCNLLVNKGDVLGLYNVTILANIDKNLDVDATYFFIDDSATDVVYPQKIFSTGLAGLAFFGHSKYKAVDVDLDITFENKLDIASIDIVGDIEDVDFEYNIAICKDLEYTVSLYNKKHRHKWYYCGGGFGGYALHTNKAFGLDALNDGITYLDTGIQGFNYTNVGEGTTTDGLETYGKHAYFYVNGDAEWLKGSVGDIAEFYVCPSHQVLDYNDAPVSIDLFFPHGIELFVHKTLIYFKEADNFKSFYLASYHGSDFAAGNVIGQPNYKYIPNFDLISLDGTPMTYGKNKNVDIYLYKNPVLRMPRPYSKENSQIYLASYLLHWTTLQHEFKPVLCKGFRYHTDLHFSTKLYELEIYTKSTYKNSLVKVLSLKASEDGFKWHNLSFLKSSTGAYVPLFKAYMYFNLKFNTTDIFTINQLNFYTKAQKISLDNIHIPCDSKQGVLNKEEKIEVTNNYDTEATLSIDLVNNTKITSLIYSSSLASLQDIAVPSTGPKALLSLREDYYLNNQGMVALNLPTYGLVNLVDLKKCYISFDFFYWLYNGLLEHDTPIKIPLDYYRDTYKVQKKYTAVSCVYCILKSDTPDVIHLIRNINVLFNNTSVPIDYIFYGKTIGDVSTKLNVSNYFIQGESLNINDFDIDTLTTWSVTADEKVQIYERDDNLEILTSVTYLSGGLNYSISKLFNISGDLEVVIRLCVDITRKNYSSQRLSFDLDLCFGCIKVKLTYNKQYIDSSCYILIGIYHYNTYLYQKSYRHFCIGAYNVFSFVKKDNIFTLYINNLFIYTGVYPETIFTSFSFDNSRVDFSAYQLDTLFVDYINIYKSFMLASDSYVGFKLINKSAIDELEIISTYLGNYTLYTSMDGNNYFLSSELSSFVDTPTLYIAVDLKKRYILDIIRNYYCSSTHRGLLFIDKYSDVLEYSNSSTSDINEVELNSSYKDCRWLVLKVPCTSSQDSVINKLGIYPDIQETVSPEGLNNTAWNYLGTNTTMYIDATNVAKDCNVSFTETYLVPYYPQEVVNGETSYSFDKLSGWIFKEYTDDTLPTLILDFRDTFLINKLVIYNGLFNSSNLGSIKTVNIYSYTTFSGTATLLYEDLALSLDDKTELFLAAPIYSRYLKIEVHDARYTLIQYHDIKTDLQKVTSAAGLKEVEVIVKQNLDASRITSSFYPIICYDLKDFFKVVSHRTTPYQGKQSWLSDEEFYAYSSAIWDTPEKVSFYAKDDKIINYTFPGPLLDLYSTKEVLLSDNVFFERGNYNLHWEVLNLNIQKNQYIIIKNEDVYDVYALKTGVGWQAQTASVAILKEGYYTISIKNDSNDYNTDWGIKDLIIYTYINEVKWVALITNTAECQSFNNDAFYYGNRVLTNFKIFSNSVFNITEYYWWWHTVFGSLLENDSTYTKLGRRSLKITLDPSLSFESIQYIPGDSLGFDSHFSIYDKLCFDLYIVNVEGLDNFHVMLGYKGTSYVTFWYTLKVDSSILSNGWNKIELFFNNFEFTNPTKETNFLNEALNIQKAKSLNYITLKFFLNGQGEVVLYLDTFRIERNVFDTKVGLNNFLYLYENSFMSLPLNGVNFIKGTILFDLKLGTSSYGVNIFNEVNTINLFTLSNNSNEYLALIIQKGAWLAIEYGTISNYIVSYPEFINVATVLGIGDIVRIRFVWDLSSEGLDNNNNNFKLYLNEQEVYTIKSEYEFCNVNDLFFKLGGGVRQAYAEGPINVNTFFKRLKIYDDCIFSDQELKLTYPEYAIELSVDDGVTYHSLLSGTLPIILEHIKPKEHIDLCIRTNKSKFSNYIDYTASVLLEWLISE
jgi:hypothetical protein